ncbi:hypothetical protein [Rhodococcus jostii]|uniref:hypothetical protein n=1 Tax=Rhodococcus jostii TaxID=132919 RepID=UPI003645E699
MGAGVPDEVGAGVVDDSVVVGVTVVGGEGAGAAVVVGAAAVVVGAAGVVLGSGVLAVGAAATVLGACGATVVGSAPATPCPKAAATRIDAPIVVVTAARRRCLCRTVTR